MGEDPRRTGVGDNDNDLYERSGKRIIPRWATIVVIVLAVIGVLFIIMLLIGGAGGHGPGRHMGMAASLRLV